MPTGKRSGMPIICPTRDVLNTVGDEWSFYIIYRLKTGTLRFGELKKRVEGISPRMLTSTLRSLEIDGLVTGRAFATIPPRVDYTITELGRSLAAAMEPLKQWADEHQAAIDANRRRSRGDHQSMHRSAAQTGDVADAGPR